MLPSQIYLGTLTPCSVVQNFVSHGIHDLPCYNEARYNECRLVLFVATKRLVVREVLPTLIVFMEFEVPKNPD